VLCKILNRYANQVPRRMPAAHIHIQARREAPLWHFSVTDNGIGIEAQHLETIFAPLSAFMD